MTRKNSPMRCTRGSSTAASHRRHWETCRSGRNGIERLQRSCAWLRRRRSMRSESIDGDEVQSLVRKATNDGFRAMIDVGSDITMSDIQSSVSRHRTCRNSETVSGFVQAHANLTTFAREVSFCVLNHFLCLLSCGFGRQLTVVKLEKRL